MDQDIFIVTRSSGQWEDSYTQSICYVESKATAEYLARVAKEEWLAAMEHAIPTLDRPDDIDNWTDEQWDIFNNGREDVIAEVYAKRKAELTIDPEAPLEDGDTVSYGYTKLSPYKGSLQPPAPENIVRWIGGGGCAG